jgi:hypothetical protein
VAGAGLQRTLDRIRFGPRRTLNVRESGLTGDDAARRVEIWLRARQLEFEGDVLVITGRGAGSRDGIAVVRNATMQTLHALKRAGVIAAIQEDTPGSFVVSLASLRTLLEAPARRNGARQRPGEAPADPIVGIGDESRRLLRDLAAQSLASLGIHAPSEPQLGHEMARQFSILVRSVRKGAVSEDLLQAVLLRGIREYEDQK